MDTNELLEGISEAENNENLNSADATEVIKKLIVFRINQKTYALYANMIREIVLDVPLFYVPFVPSYIRGFINRHGEPYTVFDLNMLFEQQKLESSTFFILNIEDDQVAFIINDVIEIQKTPESLIHQLTLRDEKDDFFLSSITSADGEEIFILNTDVILKRLERDLNVD